MEKGTSRFPMLPTTTRQEVKQRQQQQMMTPRASSGSTRLELSWDYTRRQSVAVKIVHFPIPTTTALVFRTLNDFVGRRLLKQEVLCMVRVSPHPNVVELLAVEKISTSQVRLVMEYAAAVHDNLAEVIAASPEGR